MATVRSQISQAVIPMVQSTAPKSSNARKKLWIQLATFLALAALIYLKPKVEGWLEAQNQGPASSTIAEADDKAADGTKSADQTPPQSPISAPKKSDTQKTAAKKTSDDSAAPAKTQKKKTSQSTDSRVAKTDQSTDKAQEKPTTDSAASKNQKAAADTKNADSKVADSSASKSTNAATTGSAKSKTSKSNGSSVVKMDQPPAARRTEVSDAEKNTPPPGEKEKSTEPQLGVLREIENNVFESTAGLHYVPGGAEGHRLKHVMEHAKDVPQKEVHGVFDGNRDEILAVIDEAYMKAKKGGSDVRSEKQNNRRVYTINLRRRIGQVGGRQGERQGNPDCRYIRIVLENETEVVSAFPTKSF